MSHPPSRIVLIGNPQSGRGRGAAALSEAETLLRREGHTPRVLPTERPGHAVELARGAGEGSPDLVLVLGGDGTIRDVAEGLARAGSDAPIGILPGGTGNDLCRTLGIPEALPEALRIGLRGATRRLDLWRWNETAFLNVAGIGLDAAVAALVNRRFRTMRGPLPYVAALLALLPRYEPVELSLTWPDGEWSGRAWLAAFGNGCCYGGGMQITPAAVPDDGLLDVVIIGDVSRLELLRQFPGIFRATHVKHPRVTSLRAPELTLQAPEQDCTIDGELIGRTPARITPWPGGVCVRVPR